MGIPVLILGESGAGKSASLRHFKADEIGIFNVARKPLPFRNNFKICVTQKPGVIISSLQNAEKKELRAYAIDDSQYLMAFELFNRAQEKSYEKFTDIAVNFYNIIRAAADNTPADTLVYFLHHTENTSEGRIKAKTIGQMIDNKLTLEGLFSIVLLAKTDGDRYWFETQSNGFTSAKSPMDMFPREIDNDLKAVDTAIRDYYGLLPLKDAEPDAEMADNEIENVSAEPAPAPSKKKQAA